MKRFNKVREGRVTWQWEFKEAVSKRGVREQVTTAAG